MTRQGKSETRGHKSILKTVLEHKSFPFLLIVANGCEALVSSYQNCCKTVIFILQPPASFLQSLLPKYFSPSVTDHSFLIVPSDCRINVPSSSVRHSRCFAVRLLLTFQDLFFAKWIHSLSSDRPETASLDFWRLI